MRQFVHIHPVENFVEIVENLIGTSFYKKFACVKLKN